MVKKLMSGSGARSCSVLLLGAACALSGCGDDGKCAEGRSCSPDTGGAGSIGGGGEATVGDGGSVSAGGEAVGGANQGGEGGEGGAAPPAPSSVVVHVRDYDGVPAIALDVVSNAADGSLVDQGVSNTDGDAELLVPDGGSVSVLWDDVDTDYVEHRIESVAFAGAPPPEVLVNWWAYAPYDAPDETMTFYVYFPEKPGAASYQIRSNCKNAQASTSPATITNVPGCTSDGLYDLVVVAVAADGTFLDYAAVNDRVFVANGYGLHTVSWAGLPVGTVAVGLVNIPTQAEAIWLSSSAQSEQGGWGLSVTSSDYLESPPNQYSASFGQLIQFGTRHCESTSVGLADNVYGGRNRCGATANAAALSWDVSRLSRFEAAAQTLEPLTLHWVESWPGELGDTVTLRQSWQRVEDEEYVTWSRSQAPAAGDAILPEMPASLSVYSLAAGDTLFPYTGVTHSDVLDVEGFAGAASVGLPLYGDDFEYQSSEKNFN